MPEAANACPPDSGKVFGLPKHHLLRKGWEFEQVYKQGQRLRGKGFSLIIRPNDLEYSRIGISVHRQIRGAVKRNRIKRIIRESFRLNRKIYPQSVDVVFAVRPDVLLDTTAAVSLAVMACRRTA